MEKSSLFPSNWVLLKNSIFHLEASPKKVKVLSVNLVLHISQSGPTQASKVRDDPQCKEIKNAKTRFIYLFLEKLQMDVSPLSVDAQSFWTVSLHIPPLCQHVYPVSWSMLAVVLTCVSNGRDVSSEGQPSEGTGHYQNRCLLVAQLEVLVRDWGSCSPMLDPCSGLFGGCQQHPNCFPAEKAAVNLMGWTDGGHVVWRGA